MPLHKGTISSKYAQEKRCPICGIVSTNHRRYSNGYLSSYCKECDYKKSLAWKQKNLEKSSKHRRAQRLKWHGLTFEQYDSMLEKQGGGCAICGRNDIRLVVDHCHSTHKVRGILCNNCNGGIGMFAEKEQNMLAAIRYLGGGPIESRPIDPNPYQCPNCGMLKVAGKCMTKGCK